jgi:hypothetical protein
MCIGSGMMINKDGSAVGAMQCTRGLWRIQSVTFSGGIIFSFSWIDHQSVLSSPQLHALEPTVSPSHVPPTQHISLSPSLYHVYCQLNNAPQQYNESL